MAEDAQGVSLGVSLCAFFRLLCTLCAYGPEFSTPPSPKSLKIHRNCVADGKGRVPYSAHDNAFFFRQHLVHFLLILQPSKLRKIADGGARRLTLCFSLCLFRSPMYHVCSWARIFQLHKSPKSLKIHRNWVADS